MTEARNYIGYCGCRSLSLYLVVHFSMLLVAPSTVTSTSAFAPFSYQQNVNLDSRQTSSINRIGNFYPPYSISSIRSSVHKKNTSIQKSFHALQVWKPPDDGGRGYYNLNEQGDFDPNKGMRIRRRRNRKLWNLGAIKDAIIPRRLPSKLTLQHSLIYINIIVFLYQLITATLSTPQLNQALSQSGYSGNLFSPLQILQRNLMGGSTIVIRGSSYPLNLPNTKLSSGLSAMRTVKASSSGPFTMDFIFSQNLGKFQPHRFLTAGFLHGSLLHLFFNMKYLSQLPLWLENGLGKSLFGTAYLLSIISGNIAHFMSESRAASACLGASGGICGLNGLMFILYRKMNRPRQSWAVFRNMIFLIVLGLLDSNISNASHIGGFLGGMLVGIFCSPNFRKSYVAKRKVWFEDDSDESLRRIMGPDVVETAPILDLKYLWGCILLWSWYQPTLRKIPFMIWRGLLQPGSLSGMPSPF